MSEATFDPTRYNNSKNEPFSSVLDKEISRRRVLKTGAGMSALTMFSGVGLFGCSDDDDDNNGGSGSQETSLGFQSIAGSKTDAVVVPEGYSAQVLAPWGTPLNSSANAWKNDGSNTAEDQANAVGMHHDGMSFFPINGSSDDGLLCINHEYIDEDALHPNGQTFAGSVRTIVDEVRKEINAHGVSVVRVKRSNGEWSVVENDPLNRRYTGASEMDIAGPLAGSELLVTKYAPNGEVARGTLNNCGSGESPWGTFLTCEENWPGYFTKSSGRSAGDDRIGIEDEGTRYAWETLAGNAAEIDDEFTRFDATPFAETAAGDYRNETHGHGYVVEIDPYTAESRAVKRTALGRFRHECVVYGKLVEGQPVTFYSGHDGRFEYLYKFVSTAVWDNDDANPSDRLATGDKYLNDGTLYVAKFSEGGVGSWIPLETTTAVTGGGTLGDTFATQAEVILDTIRAADMVGATPMDRPEWIAVDPKNGAVYLTLTNNTARTTETNPANPRLNNAFGHIIRWMDGADVESFDWDIFVFGSADDSDASVNLSGLTELNQFASPDGLVFDPRGILWVQTDNGAQELTSYTNDQMLAVIPSKLVDENNNLDVVNSDNQMELRRFFVGPNDCEVTGLAFTPDQKNFFANIQHPGNWPYTTDATEVTVGSVRPRATTVVITKNDGGAVGE
ncbi:PhoX family phosphatase [Spongiibacter taiwanensis]|uniref:PhoX family protein n=1 Tax=Spongiibacter taiwanensis TaxID=1748242 RepID=UPI002035D89B|nr:PhoX family phosphatase [Spongiibacter taiwanensis]USA43954.1 PhoX family phosphatase [Spongiibacter taiwanensis]